MTWIVWIVLIISALIPSALVIAGIWLYFLSLKKNAPPTPRVATTPAAVAPAPVSEVNRMPVWLKITLTIAIGAVVYFLPGLIKDSMPGKAMLSGLDTIGIAEWYEWLVWILGGLLAGAIILRIWRGSSGSSSSLKAATIFGWFAFGAIVIGTVSAIGHYWGSGSNGDVNLPVVRLGEKIKIKVPVAGTYELNSMVHNKPGEYHTDCVRLVQPEWVLTHPDTPRWQVVNTTTSVSYRNYLRLAPELQTLLTKNGVTHVILEMTRVETTYEKAYANEACPHFKLKP